MTRAEFLAAVTAAHHDPQTTRQAEEFADHVDQANTQLGYPKYDYPTAVVVGHRYRRMVTTEAAAALSAYAQQTIAERGAIYGRQFLTPTEGRPGRPTAPDTMTEMIAFLLARLDEDEERLHAEEWWPVSSYIDGFSPRRLEAETAGVRRIIAYYREADTDDSLPPDHAAGEADALAWTLRVITAASYSEHPDYRGDWRP